MLWLHLLASMLHVAPSHGKGNGSKQPAARIMYSMKRTHCGHDGAHASDELALLPLKVKNVLLAPDKIASGGPCVSAAAGAICAN